MNTSEYWSAEWRKAFDNMPKRRGSVDGRYGCLARLLGYQLYSKGKGGSYCGHSTVYKNMWRGSAPRCPVKRNRLAKLSGPHGKMVAWLSLQKLGIAHRYERPVSW